LVRWVEKRSFVKGVYYHATGIGTKGIKTRESVKWDG